MQKLLRFIRTPSKTQFSFFSKSVSASFTFSCFSPFNSCAARSYKSSSTTGCSSDSSMASSATPLLPPLVEECLGRKLWYKFKNVATQALYAPFVVCLASGNLKLDSFRNYITQDVYFLRAFSQAYEMAEECTDDDDAKIGISKLRQSVLEELKVHDSYVKEWGVNLPKDGIPNAATVKYTDFLLATASGKIDGVKAPGKLATPFERTRLAAYTLGAMTPCMRLYAFLAKELEMCLDPCEDSHPYRKWIESYASNAFQESALQIEDLLENLSVSLTGEELDIIEKLYSQAMKLEIDFFLAQPLYQKTVVPLDKVHSLAEHGLLLFSDFDLTCTVLDSSAILAEIAIITAQKLVQNPSKVSENQLSRMSSVDLRSTWGELSRQYTEEYEQCIESILSSSKEENFNYKRLHKALEDLSDFERKANLRVIDSGILKGLNVEDIKRTGERMVLQNGCARFFRTMVAKASTNTNLNVNMGIYFLSYCWCSDLIKSAFSSGGLNSVNVHTNEFVYENSLSTGEIVKKVESPIDKVLTFTEIVQGSKKDKYCLSVYIGDSVGDLLCLLEADVGIVIGSSSSLRRVGSHHGVSFIPLFHGVIKKQKECVEENLSSWEGLRGVLYTVSSWAEIHAFILGS